VLLIKIERRRKRGPGINGAWGGSRQKKTNHKKGDFKNRKNYRGKRGKRGRNVGKKRIRRKKRVAKKKKLNQKRGVS